MSIKVNIDTAKVKNIELKIEAAMYNAMVDLKMLKENEQVIPYRTGATQESAKVKKIGENRVELSYNTLYSNYIYHHPEINFNKIHNANAQAFWLNDFLNASRNEELISIIKKYIKIL